MEFKPFEKRIWLASPTMHEEEEAFVQDAFRTNWVSTVGRNIDELEKSVSEYLGGGLYAAALSSGTAALHLAFKLAGVKQGTRVFCSDLTFAATVNPISYEGGEQIFIDSEYETWNMCPEALKEAFRLYPDTSVVAVANLYGTPAKLAEIAEICKEHHAVLIEDAAESLGASYRGKKTGTFGDLNVLSFNGNKIITTSGGGMLLSEDAETVRRAKFLATQAREPYPWYEHKELGYNYRLSNILAGIGRGQLLHLDEHMTRKKEIYERYREGFKGWPVSMNPFTEDAEPNYWLSCMMIEHRAMGKQNRDRALPDVTSMENGGINVFGKIPFVRENSGIAKSSGMSFSKEKGKTTPDEIREFLARYNVEARPVWKPMHLEPYYEGRAFVTKKGRTERSGIYSEAVSTDIFNRCICLPSDIKMTEKEQGIIIEMVKSLFT